MINTDKTRRKQVNKKDQSLCKSTILQLYSTEMFLPSHTRQSKNRIERSMGHSICYPRWLYTLFYYSAKKPFKKVVCTVLIYYRRDEGRQVLYGKLHLFSPPSKQLIKDLITIVKNQTCCTNNIWLQASVVTGMMPMTTRYDWEQIVKWYLMMNS